MSKDQRYRMNVGATLVVARRHLSLFVGATLVVALYSYGDPSVTLAEAKRSLFLQRVRELQLPARDYLKGLHRYPDWRISPVAAALVSVGTIHRTVRDFPPLTTMTLIN